MPVAMDGALALGPVTIRRMALHKGTQSVQAQVQVARRCQQRERLPAFSHEQEGERKGGGGSRETNYTDSRGAMI